MARNYVSSADPQTALNSRLGLEKPRTLNPASTFHLDISDLGFRAGPSGAYFERIFALSASKIGPTVFFSGHPQQRFQPANANYVPDDRFLHAITNLGAPLAGRRKGRHPKSPERKPLVFRTTPSLVPLLGPADPSSGHHRHAIIALKKTKPGAELGMAIWN